MMSGKPIDEVKLAKDLERFDSTLTLIEKTFLGDKDFLASKEISIADICTLSEVIAFRKLKVALCSFMFSCSSL